MKKLLLIAVLLIAALLIIFSCNTNNGSGDTAPIISGIDCIALEGKVRVTFLFNDPDADIILIHTLWTWRKTQEGYDIESDDKKYLTKNLDNNPFTKPYGSCILDIPTDNNNFSYYDLIDIWVLLEDSQYNTSSTEFCRLEF